MSNTTVIPNAHNEHTTGSNGHSPRTSSLDATINAIIAPGDTFELRIPKLGGKRRTDSGYFDKAEAAAKSAARYDGKAPGIYLTINAVDRALFARAANRMQEYADSATEDKNIVRRRWLPIDIDPIRPAGISATDPEHDTAHATAHAIREFTRIAGWPDPLYADSGNGAALLYPIDLPNTKDVADLIKRVLDGFAQRFNSDSVQIDTTVHNASRIMKLYGTLACKGDNTPDRPHRRSHLIDVPERSTVVTLEQLESIAPTQITPTTTPQLSTTNNAAHLQRWAQRVKTDALKMIAQAPDGQKHAMRIKASKLYGGLIPHGLATESEAEAALYHAQEPTSNARTELQAIRDGIAFGTAEPLELPPPPRTPVEKDGALWCDLGHGQMLLSGNRQTWYCRSHCGVYAPAAGCPPLAASPTDATPTQQDAQVPARPAKELIHADELDKLPPPTFLDDEGELTSNSMVVVFGPSGGGKSFYTLSKAYDLAQDRDVVYVAAEGAGGYAARKNALCVHHKRGAGRLFFWRYAVNLMNLAEVQEFIGAIAGLDRPIVILDTLARCMVGGDENSARDMGLAISSCDTIRQATGETVMIVHHTGKNGAGERGSTALRGAADIMIELQNNDGLIEVSCSKMKDGAPFEPRKLRLMEVGESCVLVPADQVISTTSAPLSEHQRKVLETLTLAIFEDVGAKAKDLEVGAKIPHAGLFRTLSSLKNLGYISQSAKGDPYYITPTGRDKLADHGHKASQRSVSKKASKQGLVSPVSNSITTVSDTDSIKYHAVSHPFRGDTADTDTTAGRDTHTSEHDPLSHLPNVPQLAALQPQAKRDADARNAERFTALLVDGDIHEASRVAAHIHDATLRRRCAAELCKEMHEQEAA